jgi:ABC-type uncharacterized transport system substrate-binding protein
MMVRIAPAPILALMATLLTAPPVQAHPHIFIDSALEVIFDDEGRAAAVRVSWLYDDFYSLVMLQDRGLDPDGDGTLTPAEEAALNGFDMDWDADFAGDTYVLAEGTRAVGLGRPADWTVRVEKGRIISTHLRALAEPVAVAEVPLILQVYDPTYYSAYTVLGTPLLTGAGAAGCTVQVFAPDLTAAQQELQAILQEYTADQTVEMDFPAVGANFAEEARVTCRRP